MIENTVKPDIPQFTKRIGRTTYEVSVHFDENATEELHKKVERLILNDVKYAEIS